MSHGPAADGGACEPNLTPLLDVVLQLLMFFMMCVNFVTEQVNEDITLPESQAARPMDKAETDVLFLNLKPFSESAFKDRYSADTMARLREKFQEGDACVFVPGKEPMKVPLEVKVWLKQQYTDAELKGNGKVKTAIIIRAHAQADYAQVFQILQMCKAQGYTKLKLRAMTKAPGVKS